MDIISQPIYLCSVPYLEKFIVVPSDPSFTPLDVAVAFDSDVFIRGILVPPRQWKPILFDKFLGLCSLGTHLTAQLSTGVLAAELAVTVSNIEKIERIYTAELCCEVNNGHHTTVAAQRELCDEVFHFQKHLWRCFGPQFATQPCFNVLNTLLHPQAKLHHDPAPSSPPVPSHPPAPSHPGVESGPPSPTQPHKLPFRRRHSCISFMHSISYCKRLSIESMLTSHLSSTRLNQRTRLLSC